VIRDLLGRLDQSHFALISRQALADDPRFDRDEGGGWSGGNGQLGLDLRIVEDAITVVSLEPGGPADRAGVRPGWILTRIGQHDPADWRRHFGEADDGHGGQFVAVDAALSRLSGAPGSRVALAFRDGSDRTVELELERVPPYGEKVQLGNLPPLFARLRDKELATDGGRRVGVIEMNVWMTALSEPFAEAVDRYREYDGIVLDLRGNPGGVGGMVMGCAGHFIDERVSLGTLRMRGQELQFVSNPRRVSPRGERVSPFAGPLAVLIDERSASTSEIFAGGVQELGRARLFGSRTVGMALPALMERLPDGDVLYHAVADFATPRGMQIEKNGIKPDVPVELSRAGLLAGQDAAMREALRWIDEAAAR